MWLKVWVSHPVERTLNPTFRTQNTIKLEREEILRRQQGDWNVGGVSWSLAVGQEDIWKMIGAVACTVMTLSRINSQNWSLCQCGVIYYTFLLNNNFIWWTHPCYPWDCLQITTSWWPVTVSWLHNHIHLKRVLYNMVPWSYLLMLPSLLCFVLCFCMSYSVKQRHHM